MEVIGSDAQSNFSNVAHELLVVTPRAISQMLLMQGHAHQFFAGLYLPLFFFLLFSFWFFCLCNVATVNLESTKSQMLLMSYWQWCPVQFLKCCSCRDMHIYSFFPGLCLRFFCCFIIRSPLCCPCQFGKYTKYAAPIRWFNCLEHKYVKYMLPASDKRA